jgi:hypothetical protein
MTTYTLPRTGEPPLSFKGKLLAESVTPPPEFTVAKRQYRRWHEIRLFETAGGKLVVSIGFRTEDETELPIDYVFVCEDRQAVQDLLTGDDEDSFDPLENLVGYPKMEKFQQQQEKLERRVEDDYDARVSEVLGKAGFVEVLE